MLTTVLAAFLSVPGQSAPLAQTAVAPNDYGNPKTWLCRPGQQGACDVDQTTTVVRADGNFERETWKANPDAPIDCFYVYPTVSTDPGLLSDMTPDAAEVAVVRQQFARFASACRPFAPVYRQMTLAGLRQRVAGNAVEIGTTPYDDVRDAWRYYLEHDNKGRGVVLIGHSQGSFILTELLQQEIEGKQVQSRIVSAILAGGRVAVPPGRDVGGSFQKMPLCRSASQTGCVITWVTFRSTAPPPANTLFGKSADPALVAACTNPAALEGGSGALHAYLSPAGRTLDGLIKWVVPERPIDTFFVSVPDLLTAKCASNAVATYLEVTVHGDPADPRTDDIAGDLITLGNIQPNWGLHLVDIAVAQGNLVDTVERQAKAFLSRGASR